MSTNNPHLDMANGVMARSFPLLIDPAATAAALVADYAKTDPIAADEAEHGVCASSEWELESELKGAHDDDRR